MIASKTFNVGDKVILAYPECEAHKAFEDFIGFIEQVAGDECVIYKDDVEEGFWVKNSEIELIARAPVRLEGVVHKVEIKGTLDPEHTGGSVNYYKVHVTNPTTLPEAYDAEANDIIESLGLTFAEGNLFKAIWRMAADRNGKKKKGNNSVYDAEKLVFFAERVLVQEKAKQ